ncbi:MAG: hypothetical protein ABEJ73_04620 [Haloplanus sp.]
MGLRCLLGHEYANREVEREREERGNEVVVTYRTVETCDRCGERRIVSENKEVRPVRNPGEDGVTTGLGDDGGVTPDLGNGSTDEPGAASPEPAHVDSQDEAGAESGAEPEANPDPVEADTYADDENVDDAIILDDDGDDERDHGEWPDGTDAPGDEDDTTDSTPDAVDDGTTVISGDDGWPEPDGEDEGFDAEPGDGEPTDATVGGGAPEAGASGDVEAAATNGTASATGKQFVAAEEVEPVGTDEPTGETEFFCPNCGYARSTGGSSMRAGDICPDCHQGYIGERPR